MGWLITEHRPRVAAVRDIFARKLTRHARVVDLLQKFCWIPDARHARGFHGGTAPAVGWQLPQPWVVTPEGATERLDDALGNQWTVLHLGTEPNGAQSWKDAGVTTVRLSGPASVIDDGSIRDSGGTLVGWLQEKKALAVAVRPDGFVYAAVGHGQTLPPPPVHLTRSPGLAATEPTRMGISA